MTYNKAIVCAFFESEGLPKPHVEYRFHPERKWRFDFAFPVQRVYVEVDGGIWIRGGHNRGAQMKNDWEKRNAATLLGWRGLWVEPKDLCLTTTTRMIKQALNAQLNAGYVCKACNQARPKNWFIYEAFNPETKERITPICARCIRGDYPRVCKPPWRHHGPYSQNNQASP